MKINLEIYQGNLKWINWKNLNKYACYYILIYNGDNNYGDVYTWVQVTHLYMTTIHAISKYRRIYFFVTCISEKCSHIRWRVRIDLR